MSFYFYFRQATWLLEVDVSRTWRAGRRACLACYCALNLQTWIQQECVSVLSLQSVPGFAESVPADKCLKYPSSWIVNTMNLKLRMSVSTSPNPFPPAFLPRLLYVLKGDLKLQYLAIKKSIAYTHNRISSLQF